MQIRVRIIRMKTINKIFLTILLCGLLAFFSLYKNDWSSKNTIEIGSILNLSGASAFQGESSQKAIDLAVKEINSSGGVLDRQIKVNYQDNQGDNPKAGISAFYNLLNEKIHLIIGPNQTPTATALIPLIKDNEVLIVAPSVGSEKFAAADDKIFNIYPSNKFETYALAEYLYNVKGYRKIAIFGSQHEWERDQANFMKEKYEELGGVVVSMQTPWSENKDLRSESLKIKTSDPEAVVFTNYGSTAIASQRLREIGLKAPFYSVLLFQFQIDEAHGALEDTVFVATDTENKEFDDKFKNEYGIEPGFPAKQSYDAMYIIANSIKKAQSTDVNDVIKAMKEISVYSGASGELTFDSDGNAHKPTLYYQVKNSVITSL